MADLIIHGDQDASAPIELTGRKTAELIPAASLIVYPGAGHGLYASDHDTLNAALLAFINGSLRTGAGGVRSDYLLVGVDMTGGVVGAWMRETVG